MKYSFRKLINDLHLWVGLPSAVILVVMCFTGTMYVFQREITQWVDSDKFEVTVPVNGVKLTLAQLKTSLEKEKKAKVTNIQIPQENNEAWTFTLVPEESKNIKKNSISADKKEGAKEKDKSKSYLVNPYTGAIQGDAKTPSVKFFATVLQLHRWLLIENHDIGGAITGTACLMMLFLQISGLILWAPVKLKSWKKSSAWKAGFKVKTDASLKRINFDLHKTLGFYAFLFVTIMAVTGPYFAFKWYKEGAYKVLNAQPISKENNTKSMYQTSAPLSLDQILSKINTVYPGAGNTRLLLPKDSAGSYAIQKFHNGFLASSGVDRVTLDQYSGDILEIKRFSDMSLGQKIISSSKIIHTGEIFGTFTKILYFLACLIATSLPITGFYIWWNKGKKDKETTKRVATSGKPASLKPVLARKKISVDTPSV